MAISFRYIPKYAVMGMQDTTSSVLQDPAKLPFRAVVTIYTPSSSTMWVFISPHVSQYLMSALFKWGYLFLQLVFSLLREACFIYGFFFFLVSLGSYIWLIYTVLGIYGLINWPAVPTTNMSVVYWGRESASVAF